MDSSSTYYAVGLISLIVATLLFIMYINVINMDLATDEKAEDTPDQESSVQYVLMDRQRKNNHRRGEKRDYDWDYDKKHEKYTYDNKDEDSNNPYNNAYSAETIAMRKEQLKKQGDFYKKKKAAEGFLPSANDLTVKRKLQTGAENIRNTNI
jgi:hypothetical protein